MNEVRFNLKNPRQKAPSLIFIIYRLDEEKLKMSTGVKVHPKYWNESTNRVKKTHPNSKLFNEVLDQFEAKLKKIVLEHHLAGQPLPIERIKSELSGKNVKSKRKSSFLQYFSNSSISEDRSGADTPLIVTAGHMNLWLTSSPVMV